MSQPSNDATDDAVDPPSPMDAAATSAAIQDINRPPSSGHIPSVSANLFGSDDVGNGSTASTGSTVGADGEGSGAARPSPMSDPAQLKKVSADMFGSNGILGANAAAAEKVMSVGMAAFGNGLLDALRESTFTVEEAKIADEVIASLGISSPDIVSETPTSEDTPAERRAVTSARRGAARVERAKEISDIHNAYSTKKSNKPRKQSDKVNDNITKAINRDVNKVLRAIDGCGSDAKKAKIMHELCNRPEMAAIILKQPG